jgi:hypothetical protein
MSGNDRPEIRAYRELETLVHNLGDELAAFRKRALTAENQLREAGGAGASARRTDASSHRPGETDAESQALQTRLTRAEERVRQMLDRVRFLRQQLQAQSTLEAGRS